MNTISKMLMTSALAALVASCGQKKEAETEATPAPAGDLVDYAAVLSEELSLLLGRKAVLSEKKGRGKIELFFDNADDREQLIQFLKTGNRK